MRHMSVCLLLDVVQIDCIYSWPLGAAAAATAPKAWPRNMGARLQVRTS